MTLRQACCEQVCAVIRTLIAEHALIVHDAFGRLSKSMTRPTRQIIDNNGIGSVEWLILI